MPRRRYDVCRCAALVPHISICRASRPRHDLIISPSATPHGLVTASSRSHNSRARARRASAVGTPAATGCVCAVNFVEDAASSADELRCIGCPHGAECPTPNTTLATLTLPPNRWRLSARTTDIRPCLVNPGWAEGDPTPCVGGIGEVGGCPTCYCARLVAVPERADFSPSHPLRIEQLAPRPCGCAVVCLASHRCARPHRPALPLVHRGRRLPRRGFSDLPRLPSHRPRGLRSTSARAARDLGGRWRARVALAQARAPGRAAARRLRRAEPRRVPESRRPRPQAQDPRWLLPSERRISSLHCCSSALEAPTKQLRSPR